MSATARCRLAIKVIPNAPRTQFVGRLGEALKFKVHAPPLDGRANEELCLFLAETLGVPLRQVSVVQGEKSRQKLIQIDGRSLDDVLARLEQNDATL